MTYILVSASNNGMSLFEIERDTGRLYTRGMVNRDEFYTFTIEAMDGGYGDEQMYVELN